MNEVVLIPERVRIVRKNQKEACSISLAKKGNNTLCALSMMDEEAKIVSTDIILKYFKANPDEKSYPCDSNLDARFAMLRDEIKKPYPKIKLDKRRGEAIDVLEKLIVLHCAEKDYLNDLLEIIKSYDDLSDGELKFISMLKINKTNAPEIVKKIKNKIPPHYIIQIKRKVENVDAQTETIMFTEDLRNDND